MSHTRCLLLSPTQLELRTLVSHLSEQELAGVSMEVCGFGPVAAAARTSLFIARHQPKMVLLAGIAGSLDRRCAVGNAYEFFRVRSYGIGVGDGEQFQSAEQVGWHQLRGESDSNSDVVGGAISRPNENPSLDCQFGTSGELLSVCAASTSEAEVRVKKEFCPDAVAEDMEGFAVAAACLMNKVPWVIVRGISNHAGDRSKSNWQTDGALQNTAKHVGRNLANKR
ncbi:MAG: futalosine hydrolase [Pirellulales bacterium]|nr:futalosine hydrolase [Pirellulales bacterium]